MPYTDTTIALCSSLCVIVWYLLSCELIPSFGVDWRFSGSLIARIFFVQFVCVRASPSDFSCSLPMSFELQSIHRLGRRTHTRRTVRECAWYGVYTDGCGADATISPSPHPHHAYKHKSYGSVWMNDEHGTHIHTINGIESYTKIYSVHNTDCIILI